MDDTTEQRSTISTTEYSDFILYARLFSYIQPHIFLFIFSILGFIIYSICNVLLADLMQFLLDALNENTVESKGIVSSAAYKAFSSSDQTSISFARIAVPVAAIILAFTRAMGFFTGTYFMNHVARGLIHRLRCQLFDKLLLAPIKHYDRFTHGELVSKLTFNVEQVSGSVSTALKVILRDGLTVIGLATYLMYLNLQLSLLFFAVSPLIAGVVLVVGKYFRRYSRRIQDSMGDVTQISNETFQSPRDIRLFGGQNYQSSRFALASEYNRRQSLKLTFAESVATPVVQTLLAVALSILIWSALSPGLMGDFSVGSLVAFLTAAGLMGKPVRSLSGIQVILQRGLAACEDIFTQLDSKNESDNGEYLTNRSLGRVSFQNVSFKYPGSISNALEDVSFDIEPGEIIAIVGPSGSGKSTLVQLMARFYSVTRGEILLDKVDVENYKLANLRAQFSVVSQSASLFRDTIFNNIAYGSLKDSGLEQVRRAADIANATGFINQLPDGFQTVLSDEGEGISGGQRQRIAISRAVLKDAPIFILDEATSALDNESEYLVRESLDVVMQNKTSIVIAHRLSTVEGADRIIVLKEGRVDAIGTHSDLLSEGGLYAQLYQQDFKA